MRKKPTRGEIERKRKKKNTHIHIMRHIAVVTHNNIVVSFLSSKLKQMTFCWCFWHDETRAYFILGTTHLERASCSYRTRGNCDRNTRKGFQISFVSCRHFFPFKSHLFANGMLIFSNCFLSLDLETKLHFHE